jgi:gluconolactonase
MTNYEGFKAEEEVPCAVYRIDPGWHDGRRHHRYGLPQRPGFSPDESRLYVADTGRMFSDDPQHIRVYDMVGDQPVNGRHFHTIDKGCADGMRVR